MDMDIEHNSPLWTNDIWIAGYSREIRVRVYVPRTANANLPVVLFFHGGGFIGGSVEDSELTAATLARRIPALVVSVGYSLAPEFPFPAALEDGYMALSWAVKNAKTFGITPAGLGVAGYEAGGNLATCLSAIVRDRREFRFSAQVLLAPLLDPSMTLLSEGSVSSSEDTELSKWSRQYRAYLPNVRHRMHPYAAPVDSVRLGGLAPAFIATVQNHMLRIEAEKYAKDLIAAGVPAAVIRYEHVSNLSIAASEQVFEDMTAFFQRQLAADQEGTAANRRKASHGPHCVLGPARTRDR